MSSSKHKFSLKTLEHRHAPIVYRQNKAKTLPLIYSVKFYKHSYINYAQNIKYVKNFIFKFKFYLNFSKKLPNYGITTQIFINYGNIYKRLNMKKTP